MTTTRGSMIVAVEGLSGTGKTTVSALLASSLSAECISVPPPELRCVSGWFARSADEYPQIAGAFFVSALGMALVQASAIRATGRSCVLDRYVWSTLGHLAVLGAPLEHMLTLLPPIRADVRVLLTCSEETRCLRTSARGTQGVLVDRLMDLTFRERVLEVQRAFAFDLILDTDHLTARETAALIIAGIDE